MNNIILTIILILVIAGLFKENFIKKEEKPTPPPVSVSSNNTPPPPDAHVEELGVMKQEEKPVEIPPLKKGEKEFVAKVLMYHGMPKVTTIVTGSGGSGGTGGGNMVSRQKDTTIVRAKSAEEAVQKLRAMYPVYITIEDLTLIQ